MRAKAPGFGGGMVTLRQLESLVRLAEARTRCDLRTVVSKVLHQPACSGMQTSVSLLHDAWLTMLLMEPACNPVMKRRVSSCDPRPDAFDRLLDVAAAEREAVACKSLT